MSFTPKLRQYQSDLVELTERKLSECDRVVSQLPTGGGKTFTAMAMVARRLKDEPNLIHGWLTHRKELTNQVVRSATVWGVPVNVMMRTPVKRRQWKLGMLNIFGPVGKLPDLPDRVGLLTADECHHGFAKTWQVRCDEWSTAGGKIVGLSATPRRTHKKEGLSEVFNDIANGPVYSDLVSQGHLSRVSVRCFGGVSAEQIKKASTGDYNQGELDRLVTRFLDQSVVLDRTAEFLSEHNLEDERVLWFCAGTQSATKLNDQLNQVGRDSVLLLSDTKNRDEQVERFRSGDVKNLVSVDILIEGFDVPAARVAVVLRATQSEVVWRQMAGRVGRPNEDGGPSYLLDFAYNTVGESRKRLPLGLPTADKTWTLDAPEKLGKGDVIVCDCPGCDFKVHPSERFCGDCGEKLWYICDTCEVEYRYTNFLKTSQVMTNTFVKLHPREKDLYKHTTGPYRQPGNTYNIALDKPVSQICRHCVSVKINEIEKDKRRNEGPRPYKGTWAKLKDGSWGAAVEAPPRVYPGSIILVEITDKAGKTGYIGEAMILGSSFKCLFTGTRKVMVRKARR